MKGKALRCEGKAVEHELRMCIKGKREGDGYSGGNIPDKQPSMSVPCVEIYPGSEQCSLVNLC